MSPIFTLQPQMLTRNAGNNNQLLLALVLLT
jgi:hypothetical protein